MSRIIRQLVILLCISYPRVVVAQSCTASATTVAFGSVNPFSGSNVDRTATLTVQCRSVPPRTINYTAHLSTGGAPTYTQRRMTNGGSGTLNYNLYTTAARTQIWGNGTGGTGIVTGGGRCIVNCTFTNTIYGRLPLPQATAVVGAYTDTITATVIY